MELPPVPKLVRKYNQLRQNCLNTYFQAKVGKELPKQFPQPLLVGKLDVGNFASQKLPKISSGRVEVGHLLPDQLLK